MNDSLHRAIRMIGAREDERREFLIEMLNFENGGCRSAAAHALGEMGELNALRDRLVVETNKFVVAGICAWLRRPAAPLAEFLNSETSTLTPSEQAMMWERMSGERLSDTQREAIMRGKPPMPIRDDIATLTRGTNTP